MKSSDLSKVSKPRGPEGDEPSSGDSLSLREPSDLYQKQARVLQSRERIAQLLRVFASPRKRLGLAPDELLIFFAIGYLGTKLSNGTIQVLPIGMIDVATLLGIPKETVRRKILRLVQLEYVSCSPKGVFVKEVRVWCQMIERAVL
jgi:hypothetical protein